MKMEKIRTKEKPSGGRVSGECRSCSPNAPCGGYHIYVIELDEDSKYDFYVGSTHKTVGQRLVDNWTTYAYRTTGAPPLIRIHFMRMRMDFVPLPWITSSTRDDAEHFEGELADSLRDIYGDDVVKGPTNRRMA